MGLTVAPGTESKKEFSVPKKGLRAGRLVGLIDLGVQPGGEFKGEKKPDCRQFVPLYWLAQDTYEYEGEKKNHIMGDWPIRVFAGATRGHYFDFCKVLDPDGAIMKEGAGDLTKLLGKPCFVNVVHREYEGKTFANASGITAIPEDYPMPDCNVDFTVFDTDAPDVEVFAGLPLFRKKQIANGVNYKGSELEDKVDHLIVEADTKKAEEVEEDEDDSAPY